MKKLCVIIVKLSENTKTVIESTLQGKYDIKYGTDLSGEEFSRVAIILGNPSLDFIKKCPNLEWLQLESSGADNYAKSGVINPENTILTNSTGAYGHAIAEYLVAGIFSLSKKLNLYRDNQSNCEWKDEGRVKTIAGSKVLVAGLGDIGGNFAKMMSALGAEVYGIRRTVREKPDYVKDVYTLDEIDKYLPEMDTVALCLPNSDSTKYLMNADRLDLMKHSAIIANVGRGNAIDNNALAKALSEGKLYGALLDVTDPEPLPADHPLWKEKMAVITPHTSGGHHAQETIDNIENIISTNVQAYINGEPLSHFVDFETGYMKK